MIEPISWRKHAKGQHSYISGKGKYGTVILTDTEMRNQLFEIEMENDSHA